MILSTSMSHAMAIIPVSTSSKSAPPPPILLLIRPIPLLETENGYTSPTTSSSLPTPACSFITTCRFSAELFEQCIPNMCSFNHAKSCFKKTHYNDLMARLKLIEHIYYRCIEPYTTGPHSPNENVISSSSIVGTTTPNITNEMKPKESPVKQCWLRIASLLTPELLVFRKIRNILDHGPSQTYLVDTFNLMNTIIKKNNPLKVPKKIPLLYVYEVGEVVVVEEHKIKRKFRNKIHVNDVYHTRFYGATWKLGGENWHITKSVLCSGKKHIAVTLHCQCFYYNDEYRRTIWNNQYRNCIIDIDTGNILSVFSDSEETQTFLDENVNELMYNNDLKCANISQESMLKTYHDDTSIYFEVLPETDYRTHLQYLLEQKKQCKNKKTVGCCCSNNNDVDETAYTPQPI